MIVVDRSEHAARVRITARGNFSLNAHGLLLLLLSLGVITLGLAGVLAWQGYWPIPLFAMLQLALVCWIFVRAWKSAWIQEEICIDPRTIRVVQKRYDSMTETCLETAWARLEMEQPAIAWYEPRLMLRSRFDKLELGAFLTHEEKAGLAQQLARALDPHTAWHSQRTSYPEH